jgi:tape measure domain-containing protein
MAKLGDLIVRVGADTREFNKELGKIQRQIRQTSDNIMDMGKSMTMGVTLPIVGLGAAAVKAAADLETMETQFISLTGGAEQAGAMVDQLNQFAAATPFQIEEIAGAARQLLAAGTDISQVNEQLGFLGDIAATSGSSIEDITAIFAKVQAKGKVELENLNQLAERGIPIFTALSEATGLPASALGAGAVSVEQFNSVLKSFTEEGGFAAGAMERLSQTAAGKFSTALDNLKQAGASIGELLLPMVTKAIDKVTEMAASFQQLDDRTKKIILIIGGIAASIGPLLFGFAAFNQALVAVRAASLVASTAVKAMTASFAANPIGLIAVAVAAAVALIIANWDDIKAYFTTGNGAKVFDTLKQTVSAGIEAIKMVWSAGVALFQIVWDRFGTHISAYIGNALDIIMGIFRGSFGIIGNLLNAFTSLFTGDWVSFFGHLANIGLTVMQTVVRTVIGAFEQIAGAVDMVLAAVGADSNIAGWLNSIQAKVDGFFDSVKYKGDSAAASTSDFAKALEKVVPAAAATAEAVTAVADSTDKAEKAEKTYKDVLAERLFLLQAELAVSADYEAYLDGLKNAYHDAAVAAKLLGENERSAQLARMATGQGPAPMIGAGQIPNPALDAARGLMTSSGPTAGEVAAQASAVAQAAAAAAEMDSVMQSINDNVVSLSGQFGSVFGEIITGAESAGESMKGFAMAAIDAAFNAATALAIQAAGQTAVGSGPAAAIILPALITAGMGLMKSVFSNMMQFAEGGIISGPTVGLMGEYSGARTNPEVVAPLDKLRSMIGGAGGHVVVTGRLDGRDILLSSERSTIDRYRTRGY